MRKFVALTLLVLALTGGVIAISTIESTPAVAECGTSNC